MRILSKHQVKELVLYSPQHIARLEKAGQFPKRVQLGPCRVGWLNQQIEAVSVGKPVGLLAWFSHEEEVLVVGAGPIGLGVALFASLSGGMVTIMDLDKDRLAPAQDILGVDTIVGGSDAPVAIEEKTGGQGYNVVFDATGNANSMERGFDFVAAGGRYGLVSVVKESITFRGPGFHRREMTLLGSRNATSEDFERVICAVRSGQVPVDRLVTHRTTLSEAVTNIPFWAKNKNGLIKALIEIGA